MDIPGIPMTHAKNRNPTRKTLERLLTRIIASDFMVKV
jgi:hypothetical protein